MKKIYTKSVFEFNKKTGRYDVNDSESQFHYISDDAPVAMMKGGGGGSTVTNVTKTDPWSGQQPYLAEAFNMASQEFKHNPDPQYYPGNTVAPFSPQTLESQNDIMTRARAGSPMMRDAEGMLSKTVNGDYLYGGTGFKAAMDAANNYITPNVNSTFERSGRGASGLNDVAKAGALSDAFAKQYGAERENQMNAARLSPVLASQDYADFDRMAGVGRENELMNQSKINEDMSRFDYNQNSRRNTISQYVNAINGNYGGTVSSMTPQQGLNGWARYLAGAGGGAMQGYAVGGPWGAAGGAGLGLLGAYMQ